MKYQKIDGKTNQPSKFRTRDWVETNNDSKGRYDNSSIRFKSATIRSSLYDFSDAQILVKETITVLNTAAAGTAVNNTNKKVILKTVLILLIACLK